MKISVNCPSYKRPKVKTLDYLPFCKVWVCETEFDDYNKFNPHGNIIKCKKGIQGNLCRIRNHILKSEFREGADVVVLVDDDMTGIFFWEFNKKHKINKEEFFGFIQKYSILANDLGAKFWGLNINQDKQGYRECAPFSTISYIGGPFQAFLRGNECFYDERLPLKEDYDMTLQQLNKYRVALRLNKFFYIVKQSCQSGGCAAYRNFEREKQQLDLLIKKWGHSIVRYDTANRSHNLKKRKNNFDYNPIIKVPIKGI